MPHDPPLSEAVAGTAAAVLELLDALHSRGLESRATGSVPPSQLRVLRAIERSEGINLRALAKVLGIRPPAASRLCDRMQADGLIERTPSTTSRREVELWLSPRTRRVLADSRAARLRDLREIIQTLPPDSLDGLSIHLGRLQKAIEHRIASARLDDGEAAGAA